MRKVSGIGESKMKYIICVVYLILSLSGLTFMKMGSMGDKKVIFQFFRMRLTMQSLLGYVMYAASFFTYTVIIAKFELSRVIPVLGGIINILIFVTGIVLFQEKANIFSLAGCICIVIGVFLMNLK